MHYLYECYYLVDNISFCRVKNKSYVEYAVQHTVIVEIQPMSYVAERLSALTTQRLEMTRYPQSFKF